MGEGYGMVLGFWKSTIRIEEYGIVDIPSGYTLWFKPAIIQTLFSQWHWNLSGEIEVEKLNLGLL